MRLPTGMCCSLSLLLLMLTVDGEAQTPRDNQRRVATGTATITGVVLAGDARARPLRRARVTISGSELEIARTAITTDEGRFTFDSLPAGSFTVLASKDGYTSVAFGAVRPGRPGRPVTLKAGEVRQLGLTLPPGAVITGMLRDPQGDPAPGFQIAVLARRFAPATGELRLQPVPGINVVTDDRGIYRVFGLAAGSYLVTALPRFPFVGVPGDVTAVSREEIQSAMAEVQQRRTSNRPGVPDTTTTTPTSSPVRRVGLSYAPTYFPGTTSESSATAVTVAAGEVRTGVDFDLDYVPTASVDGFVAVPAGARVQLLMTKADADSPYQTTASAIAGPDGRFTFRRIQPGHYVLNARTFTSPPQGGGTVDSVQWGRTEIVVAGEDIEGVSVALAPAMTLAGELVFEGTTTAPVLSGFKLPIQITSRGPALGPFPAPVVEGSQIVLRGVVPGTYRFMSSPQGIRTRVGPWWLKSIMMDDREMLDQPLDILPNTRTMSVTFSDRASQLSGVVVNRDGAPVTNTYVVVFSDDAKTWFQYSRRVAAVQLDAQGRYTVWNLPAGNYFVAVSDDLENNEWFDPERLAALRSGASRVTIGEYQSVSRNITVGSRQP